MFAAHQTVEKEHKEQKNCAFHIYTHTYVDLKNSASRNRAVFVMVGNGYFRMRSLNRTIDSHCWDMTVLRRPLSKSRNMFMASASADDDDEAGDKDDVENDDDDDDDDDGSVPDDDLKMDDDDDDEMVDLRGMVLLGDGIMVDDDEDDDGACCWE